MHTTFARRRLLMVFDGFRKPWVLLWTVPWVLNQLFEQDDTMYGGFHRWPSLMMHTTFARHRVLKVLNQVFEHRNTSPIGNHSPKGKKNGEKNVMEIKKKVFKS